MADDRNESPGRWVNHANLPKRFGGRPLQNGYILNPNTGEYEEANNMYAPGLPGETYNWYGKSLDEQWKAVNKKWAAGDFKHMGQQRRFWASHGATINKDGSITWDPSMDGKTGTGAVTGGQFNALPPFNPSNPSNQGAGDSGSNYSPPASNGSIDQMAASAYDDTLQQAGLDPSKLGYMSPDGKVKNIDFADFSGEDLDPIGLDVFNPSNPGRAFTGALNRSGIDTILPNAGQGFLRSQEDYINRLFPVLASLYPGQYGDASDPRALSAFLGGQSGNIKDAVLGMMDPNLATNAINGILGLGQGGQVSMNPFDDPASRMRYALESNPQLMAQTLGSLLTAGTSPFFSNATQSFVANLVNSLYSNPGALQGAGGKLLQAVAQYVGGSRGGASHVAPGTGVGLANPKEGRGTY